MSCPSRKRKNALCARLDTLRGACLHSYSLVPTPRKITQEKHATQALFRTRCSTSLNVITRPAQRQVVTKQHPPSRIRRPPVSPGATMNDQSRRPGIRGPPRPPVPPLLLRMRRDIQPSQAGPRFRLLLGRGDEDAGGGRLDGAPQAPGLVLLGDDDVVEMPRHLHPALFAVGSVPYTERPHHAGLERRPRVDRVLGARVALSGGGRGRAAALDVHGVAVGALGARGGLAAGGARVLA